MDEEELGLVGKKAGSDSMFKKYDDVNAGKVKLTGKASLSNQMASTYRGQNTGLGKSKYDKGIIWDADVNPDDIQGSINEHRYNRQSGTTQLAAGVGRAATKALVEVAKLPGVIGGIVAAPFVPDGEGYDMAFNNQWTKTLDSLNETINTEALPVYVGRAIKDGNLWDAVTSTSFWATDGADGLGYMLGMMAPGAALNKIGLGAKLLGAGRKAAQLAGMTQKTEAAVATLKTLGMTGRAIDIGLGATANTVFEAGAEAAGVGNDLDSKKDEYLKNYSVVLRNKQLAIDNRRKRGEISMEEANKLSAEASAVTGEESFAQQRAAAMRDTFKSNLAILIVPNLLMSKALYGKHVDKLVHQVEKTGMNAVKQRVGAGAKRYGGALISEGIIEEAGQSTAQNLFTKKAMKGELDHTGNMFMGGLQDFSVGDVTDEYINTVSSHEGHKAIFLGAMMGGPMMSHQGRKEDVANRKSTNAILDGIDDSLASFNTTFENDVYKTDEKGGYVYKKDADGNLTSEREIDNVRAVKVMRALNYQEADSKRLEKGLAEGDERVVQEIKQKAIFDLIAPSIHNGEAGIEALKAKLAESSKFQEILERDANPKTANETSEFVKSTLEEAVHLQKQNEKFLDFSKDVIKLDGVEATPKQKEDYLNNLNMRYLQVKHDQYNSQKKLAVLEAKREKLYDELDIDPLYDVTSEFPMTSMKPGIVNDKVMEDRAKSTRDAINSSDVLKSLESDLAFTRASIAKNKADVHAVWSGSDGIAKSFEKYISNEADMTARLSDENAAKAKEAKDKVSTVQSLQELDALLRELSKNDTAELTLSTNPVIEEAVAEKKAELEEIKVQEEVTKLEEKIADEIDEPTDGIEVDAPVGVPTPLDVDTESIQSDKVVEVNEVEDEVSVHETPVVPVMEVDNPNATHGNSRIISTNRVTGEALFPNLQAFVDFERVARDKTKDQVTFRVGDVFPKGKKTAILDAMAKIKAGKELSNEELSLLEDFLPLATTISNFDSNATSFLDSMAHVNPAIVKTNTLPLRKAIVAALIANKGDFNNIKGKIDKQEPGWLTVEDRVEGEPVQKNSILELDVFKDMSEDEKVKYFQKNSAYVDFFGALRHTVNNKLIDAGFGNNNAGEVFLKIPKANGSDFWLKLNTNQISDTQANDLFNLMVLKFEHFAKTKSSTITLEELSEAIDTPGLKSELASILKNSKNNTEKTVNTLIDILIHNGNSNTRTAFGLYFRNETIIGNEGSTYKGRTGVRVGTLYNKLSGGDMFTTTIEAKDILADREAFRENFKQFFKYKRHNVLIKHSTFNFTKPEYIKYLLDPANPILTTNAVVNEPTFQGYANIYLNQAVTNTAKPATVKPTVKPVVVAPTVVSSDLQNKIDDIEKRRLKEINTHYRKSDLEDFKVYNGVSVETGQGSFSFKIIISKEKGVKKGSFNDNSYAQLSIDTRQTDKSFPVDTIDQVIIDDLIEVLKNDPVVKRVNVGKTNVIERYSYPEVISEINQRYDNEIALLQKNISPSDKIIFGHPGIGKTYLKESGRTDVIDFDSDYKSKINIKFGLKEGFKARNDFQKNNKEKYQKTVRELWNEAKQESVKTGKQLFASDMILLREFPNDFDKVITMSKETFVDRAKQRNDYTNGETESWKDNLDIEIAKINKSKIIETDKYLSELVSLNQPKVSESSENEVVTPTTTTPNPSLAKIIRTPAPPVFTPVVIQPTSNVVEEADQVDKTLNALEAELKGLEQFHAAGINRADQIEAVKAKIASMSVTKVEVAAVKEVVAEVKQGNVDAAYLEDLKATDKPKLMKVLKHFLGQGLLTAVDMRSDMSVIADKIGFHTVAEIEKNC